MRIILATLPALLIGSLLTPAPAHADDLVVRDARHDYWHDYRSDGETPIQATPDYGDPDLLRTVYHHTAHSVRVRLKMAQLDRGDGGYWKAEARYRTDTGLTARATVFKAYDGRTTTTWYGPGTCVVEGEVDWADDAITIVVPRGCLHRPSTVEFKSATQWSPTSDDYPYLDVSGSDGYRRGAWSEPVSR
ncbi:hypothetical protein F0U44_02900 [Nocardioides humilatus]|uniref:Uncharacterized protein n=1 Tax=Nocardioides humilatus TaxID=2607660 RepID=A0A5B1LKJ6_9ACTN|nr:hypothetical protein [Nocardioides humilatus]KAA1421275.1 hypothetical protein F0U44_02900 [Nocardioides humilatus]